MGQESEFTVRAQSCLEEVKKKTCSLDELMNLSIQLASWMLQEGNQEQKQVERSRQKQLAGMIADPHGKIFTSYMADQCFRSKDTARVADQLIYLINKFGIPKYLSPFKRLQLKIFTVLGRPLSAFMIPAMAFVLRKETEEVILPGEGHKLGLHITRRHRQGVRINLNHLGEAILGEEEALQRLQLYIDDLAKKEIEYVSIKISTIYSQLNLLAWDNTVHILCERLRKLYRAARHHKHTRPDGSHVEKFVNLDMEEYRDLHLTVDLFKKILDEEEFIHFSAGIVLQAYLPDTYEIQKDLTKWAMKRCAQGGAPIKIRIVKGANLAMEKLEAALRGWEPAPYNQKVDVDANYKRMLLFACQKEHAHAVNIGIGSHNLFDIAFGMLLRKQHGLEKEICFEMLEGMAGHLSRVVQSLSGGMLLYCPSAKRHEFQNAVAYLVRRLDENTADENFLRHSFGLQEGSASWNQQVERFKQAFTSIPSIRSASSRQQNRLEEPKHLPLNSAFENESDTDFSLPHNREWAHFIVKEWSHKQHPPIPLVIDGQAIVCDEKGIGVDPSCPNKKLYNYAMADENHVELALKAADDALKQRKSVAELSQIMARVAQGMRRRRGDLIGSMMADGGKTFAEADVEVSEAIDMAEYYRRSREELESHHDLTWTPKGVVVVISPWNFPCAIPAGGIIAALMGGNSVIFKPSRDTILIAWVLVNIFWEAGISKEMLQFLTGSSSVIGNKLISDSRVKSVILTGSTATGKHLLNVRPDLHLMAETGGKNAIIVTNLSDRDLAIKEIVHSAFSHAGQKCSAASLLILEKEVYDDLHFRQQLRDAAASLVVGSPWNLSTKVSPLIHPPEKDLDQGLKTLSATESWLLQPKPDSHNPNLWSPGIKWGVKEGSFSHQTELFGPVLGVMRAENLDEAITFANGTRYGLTSGLHSLDEREHAIWLEKIEAGNCYINRGITGAIVRRQPFGGCKESCIGPGSKAGGPNYLIHLMNVQQSTLPTQTAIRNPALHLFDNDFQGADLILWERSVASYAFWWEKYQRDDDPSCVAGQDNFLRYLPQKGIVLRLQPQDTLLDIARVCAAALTCGVSLQLSCVSKNLKWASLPGIEWIEEAQEQFLDRIHSKEIKRLRLISTPPDPIVKAAAQALCYICQTPPLANGRIELLNYLREVAISIDYHRYGNLGERALSSQNMMRS